MGEVFPRSISEMCVAEMPAFASTFLSVRCCSSRTFLIRFPISSFDIIAP